ncbi:hypothetical protein MOB87_20245 [Bacillus sonorensis]|uniref:hypothetical protein n=1 Tax=Bacillus sonorensis TaxID=119858 RepID=UPI00227F75D6|nr:hypothetical protein [Bacillus sonorensis]MCY8089948.1 hypothetical protein [Bacillus sonorensis]
MDMLLLSEVFKFIFRILLAIEKSCKVTDADMPIKRGCKMAFIFLIISMFALGAAFATFFYMMLNNGLKGALDLSKRPVGFMAGAFLFYIAAFVLFIIAQ